MVKKIYVTFKNFRYVCMYERVVDITI
jgi:hypothetical protein